MATIIDLSFEDLVAGAPRIIRKGLSGTKTFVFQIPDEPTKGLVVELNQHDKVLGSWTIKKGRAYRVLPQKVVSMPYIENDPNPIRRFCRKNGLSLKWIKHCERGEGVYFGPAHHRGDSNHRSIKAGEPPVCLKAVKTINTNPSWVEKILVVKGEEPKTYEEFCAIAQEWEDVKSGRFSL